jgi:glycosyltransferase involved in cell wall biosynthesis
MKILQVSHGLPPKENAGVELYTYYLSKALVQLDHEVHIFCRDTDPERKEFSVFEDRVDGLRVTRTINNLKDLPDVRAFYDNSFFDDSFSEVLKREKPDVVHFQHLFGLSANLIRIAKEKGYPVVLTLHDFFLLCHRIHLLKEDQRLCPGPLYGLECASCLGFSPHSRDIRTKFILKIKDRLPFPVIKWTKRLFIPTRYLCDRGYEAFHRYRYIYEVLKKPDLLLAPSRFVRDVFVKYYPFVEPRTKVFPLGIPPIREDSLSQGPTRASDGKIRFCYYGNVLPLKGLHVLIEAFNGLPEGKAALTIYGGRTPWNGGYYDRLKRQASGHLIEFLGSFRREDLSGILKDQEVVVLPSICYETYSFVIREANSLGRPVVASRIGAIPEAVEEGKNGLLFTPGDSEDLRRCMLRFIEEPELIQTMDLKARRVKMMAEHAAELAGIYQGVIQTSDPRPGV